VEVPVREVIVEDAFIVEAREDLVEDMLTV